MYWRTVGIIVIVFVIGVALLYVLRAGFA